MRHLVHNIVTAGRLALVIQRRKCGITYCPNNRIISAWALMSFFSVSQ